MGEGKERAEKEEKEGGEDKLEEKVDINNPTIDSGSSTRNV